MKVSVYVYALAAIGLVLFITIAQVQHSLIETYGGRKVAAQNRMEDNLSKLITALQNDNRALQDKVAKLESKLHSIENNTNTTDEKATPCTPQPESKEPTK